MASVPERHSALGSTGVRIGQSVRSVTWILSSQLNNWCAGRGWPLVPSHCPLVTIPSLTSSEFFYRVRPRYPNTRLRFSILLTAETESGVLIDIPSGTRVGSYSVRNRRAAEPLIFDADLAAKADEETTLSIKIEAGVSSVVVEGISIEALPRSDLALDPNEMGCSRLSFWHRQPISERNYYLQLLQHQSALKRSARRAAFQMCWGSDSPWSMATAGPVDVFDAPFSLLGRYVLDGDTTREHAWRVRAYCSDGTTSADVTLTNTGSGSANTTISIPTGSTSPTWFPVTTGDPDTFNCNAEDPSHAKGLRGSARDEHTITVTRTAGSGTVYLETVSIWETPDAVPPAPTGYRITDAGDRRITDASDPRITD